MLKTKSSKNLFGKLNEYSKELYAKQEAIAKKHSSLSAQYEELEHLKNNMNILVEIKQRKKSRLLVQLGNIKMKKEIILRKRVKYRKKLKDKFMVGVVL